MPVLARRIVPWLLGCVLVVIMVAGFSGEASAQVYAGTLTFVGLPSANITITVVPGGPAFYTTTFLGQPFDSGVLTATVNGSVVTGVLISNLFAPCLFSGSLNGNTATLSLDPGSCGGPGVMIVSRIG